ncbi:putative disease resistance protein [Glycine max]|nr:putative disease resistance protein [Glycine max]
MDAVSSALIEPVTNSVLDLVKKHVDYIRYRQNVGELYECVEQLELDKERVDHQCNRAVKNGHKIEVKAREWSRKVGEFKTEVENYKNDEGHRKAGLTNCLFPYFRYRLGRLAKKKAVEGKKLIDGCPKPDEIAFRGNVTFNDAILSNTDLMEFDSRKSIMEDIMEKLEDPTVKMIGVHGPGGVGKSTLIKAIAGSAQVKKLFNVVAFSEITANPNVKKIQEDIAYVLGLTLEGEGENVRADSLRRRLKQEKENTLIILDDLWDRLDLNKLGIPLDDDMNGLKMKGARKPDEMSGTNKEKSHDDYKGCKILLTSRDTTVLSEKMAVKSIFGVKELEEAEAMRLLKKVTGIPDQMSHSKQEIVRKYCAGIPMAIVTVGRALRNKSESVWEATLDKLKRQELVGAQYSMEISVKMSYDHLENEELKSIFLLCAQMGHQPLIMDLVKYCFGLGILEGVYSLREARDKINIWIQKLKHSGLVMLDESSSIHFNMHDMVRDAALSIAHKEKNVFTLRNGKLDDWPELERCTSISICNSDIIDELPNVINCPQLKFFQINSDDPSVKIPESFFNEMKKLRVLILTGIHLESLPPSIQCLSNLRLLCLERCILDGNLSFIGELKKLRILSFSGSQLKKLPAELCCLDKLQLLDISNCSRVEMIPRNLISRLISLEELYIRKSLIKKLTEGETNRSRFSFLPELKHLHQLKVVDLCIPCAEVLPKDLFFDKLNDYKIVIGGFETLLVGDFRMPNKYEAFRSLALQLKDRTDNIHSQTGMKLLFKRVENLLLGELSGVQNVIDELNLDGFPCLKHLSITNNDGIKYINSMDLSHSRDVFPNLESLCLNKLTNIEMICRSPVTVDSFAKLKTIKVIRCTCLKNLFSFYKDKFVSSLETIDVSDCGSLKEIFEILVNPDKVELLKLHSLTLKRLPSFTSFYNYRVEGPSESQLTEAQTVERDEKEITIAQDERSGMAAPLFGELVEIPNLESLNLSSVRIHKIWSDQPLSSFCFQSLVKLVVEGCDNLRYLCSLSVASGLKKLKGLFVSKCRLMEKIFETEGNSADKKVCVFPKLEEIDLSEMNMLTDIWHAEVMSADSFSSLISVHIYGCKKIDKIFPSHMEGWFASLNSLKVYDCESVEVIFEIKDSQQVDVSSAIDTNLQLIDVWRLPNLKLVWSTDPGGILNFKRLRSIEVDNCDKLRNVFPASVAKDVRKLESMSVMSCEGMLEIVEDESETNNETLMFPELTNMKLYSLSNLKRFYKGKHFIECPRLKKLTMGRCEKLKTFPIETSETTNEEVKPVFSAEKVIPNLEYMDIYFDEAQNWLSTNTMKYRMHSLKELSVNSVKSGELLRLILYSMPNLEKLQLDHFDSQHLLKLTSVPCLGTVLQLKELVLWSSKIRDLGFEREPVLQRLELLSLYDCNKLRNLAPRSVSLAYLTNLKVSYCNGLNFLMASSTARSLVQLKSMKVIYCDNVKEIVTIDENKEGRVMEIEFSKLITIELQGLRNLTSFCSYKNCEFKFPSLEMLIVNRCPMMETLTENRTTAPKLQNIFAFEGEKESRWQWEGDLNATIQKDFKNKLLESARSGSSIRLSNSPVQKIWHGSLSIPDSCFSNLGTLIVGGCQFLSDAVLPFNLLPLLPKLEELEVENCEYVKTIFDVKYITQDRKMTTMGATSIPLPFPLKKLTLSELPNLENVWNEHPHRIPRMQLLQEVYVDNCKRLASVFPTSVAKDLLKLENLVVKHCEGLMAIVAEHNADPKGTNLELTFPSVKSLTLWDLPKFNYNGIYCIHDATKIIELTPNLQHLTLGQNELKMILHGEIQGNHLNKLKVLTLYFHVESDVFPHGFLQLVPNIEELVVCDGSFKEIFCLQSPNVDDTTLLSQLKVLGLESLPELVSIGSLNLVPCTMSFSNLTKSFYEGSSSFPSLEELSVKSCNSLLCLFTSSTAKSLAQLQKMKIKFCESIKEIVSKEGDESHEDEIKFPQLNCLALKDLPDLRSFYEGSLSFPSLEKLSVIKCHGMETLCPGNLKADKLLGIKLKSYSYDRYSDVMPLEIDLKSTIRKAFLAKFSKSARRVSDLRLRDNPLQKIWQGSQPIPYLCFSNLHSLIVDGCQFLSDAVLPFNLLPFLTELETLEVRDCDSVKTIFDRLPNLENVWNDDPHRILRMQLLQQVHVEKCENLTSVFPATVAKDIVKLENLVVQHCEGLMAIVAEDNADPNGTNLELTFLCVTSLTICDLPKLKCFLQCDMLKTFSHVEPNTKNQICIEKVPFLLQLTPNLQQLTLGENELKMIPHGEFLGNLLHNLKVLILLNFSVESYEFAYGFLQQVPNIEKLEVSCSSFKEIFCFQSPNVDDTALLSQLKVLSLESLSELETIGIENTLIDLRNLETLDVSSCSVLRNLAPFPICFPNLMCLFVFECHGLENLFTYSTAKSLSRLKIMEIRSCESIKEIVSKEGDGSNEDEIIFRQLLYLNLESLPNLTSFYTGRLIKFQKKSEAIPLDIDLNSTILNAFQATMKIRRLKCSSIPVD